VTKVVRLQLGFAVGAMVGGLLLISNFVFNSVTFCINPFCVFRFLGLFSYVLGLLGI
jgi:hypothetical protein